MLVSDEKFLGVKEKLKTNGKTDCHRYLSERERERERERES